MLENIGAVLALIKLVERAGALLKTVEGELWLKSLESAVEAGETAKTPKEFQDAAKKMVDVIAHSRGPLMRDWPES